ncbi:MAG: hypothetical protein J6B71_09450 [Clostridia bacterium]|nr:hypothetical protein [Clostridia bacterium]
MKKTILIFLLILATLLCACENNDSKQPETTSEQQTEVTDLSAEDDDYKEIARRDPSGYTEHQFGLRGNNLVLDIDFPAEWKIEAETELVFSITADGRSVGRLIWGTVDDNEGWKIVETDNSMESDLKMKMYIEKKGSRETLAFRYRFEYEYTEQDAICTVTLLIDCAEVNDYTQKRLLLAPSLYPLRTDAGIGILQSAKKDNILILGNSFINSSSIGSIFREMLQKNGKAANVQAISRGYATVETYVTDSFMMENIRAGAYDIIFICGFYSTSEIAHLKTLKAACDESDTTLVIFPAHNESENAFTQACKETSLPSLNWKGEINALIKTGISKRDFCIDDMHQHSTALAGYVGAHMIYRALYGSLPTNALASSIDQSYVNELLGDYVQTGSIPLRDADAVKYFH